MASPDTRLHWDDADVCGRGSRTTVALMDALRRVIVDESEETAIAAVDWALHSGRIDQGAIERMLDRMPSTHSGLADWFDGRSESYPESIARIRLRRHGFGVRSQVPVGPSLRIDLVVDGRVAIEVEGEEFHRDRFLADRMKDIHIALARYHGLRFAATTVLNDWPLALEAVYAVLRRPTAPV